MEWPEGLQIREVASLSPAHTHVPSLSRAPTLRGSTAELKEAAPRMPSSRVPLSPCGAQQSAIYGSCSCWESLGEP